MLSFRQEFCIVKGFILIGNLSIKHFAYVSHLSLYALQNFIHKIMDLARTKIHIERIHDETPTKLSDKLGAGLRKF